MTDQQKTQEIKRLASELYRICETLTDAVGDLKASDLAGEPDELMGQIADGIVGITQAFGRLGDVVRARGLAG